VVPPNGGNNNNINNNNINNNLTNKAQPQPPQPQAPTAAATATVAVDPVKQRFEVFKQSGLYVPPFDEKILVLPEPQLAFMRQATAEDSALFREILNEVIQSRRKFAASVKLMFKYATKLLGRFIKNRRDDLALKERVEPSPAFFRMLADLSDKVISRSGQLKSGYSKDSLDMEQFRSRVEAIFDHITRVINVSPVGGYLRWDTARLFTDQPKNQRYNMDLAEEAADLTAVSMMQQDFCAPIRILHYLS